MAESITIPPPRRSSYRHLTHRPLNCLLFVLPLLGLFHIGSAFAQTTLLASRHLERLLGVFGPTAGYLPPLLVVAALLLQHVAQRRTWRAQGVVLAGMVIESMLWAVSLYAVHYLCARLLHTTGVLAAGHGQTVFQKLLLAVGAGVYEEFIFRLIMVGLVTWTLHKVFGLKRDWGILLAIVAGALAFSLYHFSWTSPDVPFEWEPFVWRAAAGLCLGVIYAYRGFGIAVGTHALWNLYCVLASA